MHAFKNDTQVYYYSCCTFDHSGRELCGEVHVLLVRLILILLVGELPVLEDGADVLLRSLLRYCQRQLFKDDVKNLHVIAGKIVGQNKANCVT